jgi:hypothetical protein
MFPKFPSCNQEDFHDEILRAGLSRRSNFTMKVQILCPGDANYCPADYEKSHSKKRCSLVSVAAVLQRTQAVPDWTL